MQMDQKKKVLMLGGAIAVLLLGVAVLMITLKKDDVDPNALPGTVATTPGPMESPAPPPPPPTGSGMASATNASPTPAPGSSATGNMGAMAAQNIVANSEFVPPVDPFRGYPRIYKVKIDTGRGGTKNVTRPGQVYDPSVSVYELPAVLSTPTEGSTGVFDGGGGNDGGGNDGGGNDDDFFGAAPGAELGRNAGWIATEANGRITAYFDQGNGTMRPVEVGAVVNGFRVKAISKEYVLLVNERTGREERIRMSGNQHVTTASRTTIPSVPAAQGYAGH